MYKKDAAATASYQHNAQESTQYVHIVEGSCRHYIIRATSILHTRILDYLFLLKNVSQNKKRPAQCPWYIYDLTVVS